MSSSGSVVAAIVAVRAAKFKKYLIACEYLQIEPAKVYGLDFIKTRIENVRSHWNELDEVKELKKLNKRLKWLEKNYFRVTKEGFSIYKFAKKCDKFVHNGKLKIHEGSVNETYVKCELSQKNYDFYSKNKKRRALIVIGVIFGIVLFFLLLKIVSLHFI